MLPIGCAASRFATPQGAERPLIPGSTLSKLGTLVPTFVFPGASWLRGQVPSLSGLLSHGWSFVGILPKSEQPGCIFSKLGT